MGEATFEVKGKEEEGVVDVNIRISIKGKRGVR